MAEPDSLDRLTNSIEQGFMQKKGWETCRHLLENHLKTFAGPPIIYIAKLEREIIELKKQLNERPPND